MHPLKDCAWIALSGKSKGVQEKNQFLNIYLDRESSGMEKQELSN